MKSLREANPSPEKGDTILIVESDLEKWPEGLLLTTFDRWRIYGSDDLNIGKELIIDPYLSEKEDNYISSLTRIIFPISKDGSLPHICDFHNFSSTLHLKYSCDSSAEFYLGDKDISKALKKYPGFEKYADLFI